MTLSQSRRTLWFPLLLLLLAFGCGKGDEGERLQRAVGKADTYYRAGLYKEALTHYQEALALSPTDGALHMAVGMAYEGLGLATDALAAYDEAIRLSPSLNDAYRRKARLLLSEDKTDALAEFVKSLSGTTGLEGLAAFIEGEIARSKNDWDKALERYTEANRLQPDSPEIVEALANAHERLGNKAEAIRMLSVLVEKSPQNTAAAARLADFHHSAGEPQKAIEVLKRLLTAQPNLSGARAALANLYLEGGDLATAEREVLEALKSDPDDPLGLYVSGRIALERGETDQALKELRSAMEHRPNEDLFKKAYREARIASGQVVDKVRDLLQKIKAEGESPRLHLELADAYLFRGEPEAALPHLEAVLRGNAENQTAHILEAFARLSMGQFSDATKTLEAVQNKQDPRFLAVDAIVRGDLEQLGKATAALKTASGTELWGGYFQGAGLLYSGQFTKGLEELDSVVRKNENFAPPIYEMARAYLQANEPHLAFVLYQRLMDLFPDSLKPSVLSARTLIRIGHRERAKILLDGVLKKDPTFKPALLLMGTVHLQEKDFGKASKAFEALVAASTESAMATVFYRSILAKTYVFDRQYKQALELYDLILRENPTQTATYIEKSLALMAQGQGEGALAACRAGIAAATETGVLKVVEAVILQQTGKAEEGLAKLESELASGTWDEPMKRRLVPIHVGLQVSAGKFEEARAGARASGYPARLVGYFLESIDLCEKSRSDLKKLSLGLLFTFYQWPDAALEIYRDLSERNPKDKLLLTYLGEAEAAAGLHAEALKTYSRAVDLDPNDPVFLEKRAQMEVKLKRLDDAVRDFSTALAADPENVALHFQLASLYESQGLIEDAVAGYRKVVELGGKTPLAVGALNNVAWLLAREEATRAEALEFAKRAYEAAPENPRTRLKDGNILDTIGWVHFLSGKTEEARGYIEQALQALPNHPTINYHLGRVYEELGQTKAAIIQYGKAVDFDPNFEEADEARDRAIKLQSAVQAE
ncbi:MAG: tetratricopeptide repeat protein [Candidatus Omnitrophica bacterium]|nr:tetratricopeptide repeat protein [Candidatus Omnitrophota bacterium]